MEKESWYYPEACERDFISFTADIWFVMAFLGWILHNIRHPSTVGQDTPNAMDGIRQSAPLLFTDCNRNSRNGCCGKWSLSAGEKRIQIQEIKRNREIYAGTVYTAFLVHQHGVDGCMQHSLPLGMVWSGLLRIGHSPIVRNVLWTNKTGPPLPMDQYIVLWEVKKASVNVFRFFASLWMTECLEKRLISYVPTPASFPFSWFRGIRRCHRGVPSPSCCRIRRP